MANRLVASPDAFNLSFPGINVLAASGTGLAFDGNWATPARFVTGSISGTSSSGSPSNRSIGYGKTFTAKPFTMIKLQAQGGFDIQGSGFGDAFYYFAVDSASVGSAFLKVTIGLSGIDFQIGTDAPSMSYVIKYSAFDYRIGF